MWDESAVKANRQGERQGTTAGDPALRQGDQERQPAVTGAPYLQKSALGGVVGASLANELVDVADDPWASAGQHASAEAIHLVIVRWDPFNCATARRVALRAFLSAAPAAVDRKDGRYRTGRSSPCQPLTRR